MAVQNFFTSKTSPKNSMTSAMHYSFISRRCLCSDVQLVFAYQFMTMKVRNFCFHVKVFHKPAQNKFRFNFMLFSIYQMSTMYSIKDINTDGRREKCNKILWTAILKWQGSMYKRKKAGDGIKTYLYFYTY